MKNLKKKIVALIGATMLASSAFAITSTSVGFTGDVVDGCVFSNPNYSANFGNIPVGTVGTTNVQVVLYCTFGTAYTVVPAVDVVDYSGTEAVKISAYTDVNRTSQLTSTAGITGIGEGGASPAYINVYLRANSVGKSDFGQGSILSEAQTITTNYALQVNF